MDGTEFFKQIVELVPSLGIGGIFLYLYLRELNAHEQTRKEYRDDLREIAGLRQNLRNTQYYVDQAKQFPREPEMRDFPDK